jgi:hypothetical protein
VKATFMATSLPCRKCLPEPQQSFASTDSALVAFGGHGDVELVWVDPERDEPCQDEEDG